VRHLSSLDGAEANCHVRSGPCCSTAVWRARASAGRAAHLAHGRGHAELEAPRLVALPGLAEVVPRAAAPRGSGRPRTVRRCAGGLQDTRGVLGCARLVPARREGRGGAHIGLLDHMLPGGVVPSVT
jgi:hypothetical protein